MRVVFVSNFLNHHQRPWCDVLAEIVDEFYFISTVDYPQSFLKMGYPDYRDVKYNIKAYSSEEEKKKALDLCDIADIVIVDGVDPIYYHKRLVENKIVFIYNERWFKKRSLAFKSFLPHNYLKILFKYTRYRNNNLYMLCASAYTAADVRWFGAFLNKCYKWGYFTQVEKLDIDKILSEKRAKNELKILWCARFLDWKHPEMMPILARTLKDKGYKFTIEMLGTGQEEEKIREMITTLGVEENVKMLGNKPNDEVLKIMRTSHLFVFTSDRNEGWGAVLNEAMSNGCTMVVSHEVGAAPFLVQHEKNGLIFKSKDSKSLLRNVEALLNDEKMREEYAFSAYETVRTYWSPQNAAYSFKMLSESLLAKAENPIVVGPCSHC